MRRSETLVFFFDNNHLCCKNYLTGVEAATAPVLVAILNCLDRWRTTAQVVRLLPGFSAASVTDTLRKLLRYTFVVGKGSIQHAREKKLAVWNSWGVEARFFHFATKPVFKSPRQTDERAFNRARLARAPQPPFFKRYPIAKRIELPHAGCQGDSEFPCVLLRRRTHRQFGPSPVSLQHISKLLHLTWGVTGHIAWPGLGRLPVKTSPSGGARHSIEVYVCAFRVARLKWGVYHYRADTGELERLTAAINPMRAAALCGGQEWISTCSALFIMTSVIPRVTWRYRSSRAYRVVLLEAGHFCQTFCLTATWLGLAPFSTAALADDEIEAALGIDGARETVLYAAGVGTMPRISRSRRVRV